MSKKSFLQYRQELKEAGVKLEDDKLVELWKAEFGTLGGESAGGRGGAGGPSTSGVHTVDEFLDLPLPRLQIRDQTTNPTTSMAVGRHYPSLVVPWSDFCQNAAQYRVGSDVPAGVEPKLTEVRKVSEEPHVWDAIRHNIAEPFEDLKFLPVELCQPSGLKHRKRKPLADPTDTKSPKQLKRSSVVIGNPDFVSYGNGEVNDSTEVKTPWSLTAMPDRAADVADKYNTGGLERHLRRAIAQTVGYMLDNGVRHGRLTTYERTWHCRWVSPDVLAISDAVRYDGSQPSALRAWAYGLHLATTAEPLASLFEAVARPRRLSEEDKSRNLRWRDFDFKDAQTLGSGASGTVVSTIWRKTSTLTSSVAVKIFDFVIEGARNAYFAERDRYQNLEDLQGRFVPKLHGAVTFPSGARWGLVFDEGQPLSSDFKDWTDADRSAAIAALEALADKGFVQADVKPQNFLRLYDTVCAIDLVELRPIPEAQISAYKNRLRLAFA